MLSEVYGQDSVKTKLNDFLNGRIPTVLLFVGPYGVGKLTTALNFIDEIYKGTYSLKNHPDIKIIIPEKKVFKLEYVTQLISQSSLSPLELSHNYFILKNVHLLNNEAANALLKVLEENQDYNKFILIAEDAQKILPTIISRSTILEFGTVNLNKFFPDITSFEEKLAYGSVGKYLDIKNLFLEKKYDTILDFVKKYPGLSYAEILEWFSDLEKPDYLLLSDLFILSINELLSTSSHPYLISFLDNMFLYQEKLRYSISEDMHFKNALINPKKDSALS